MERKKQGNQLVSWALTYHPPHQADLEIYQKSLSVWFKTYCKNYIFQLEKGEKGSYHFQCTFRLAERARKTQLLQEFYMKSLNGEGIFTISPCTDTRASFRYCMKDDTRVDGPWADVPLTELYSGEDLKVFEHDENFFPWQTYLRDNVLNKPGDSRTIWLIHDRFGNSGKSLFVKNICYNRRKAIKIPISTATQVKAAIISAGPQQIYFVDIPRTTGKSEDMQELMSTLEDLKGGYVVSSFYGKYQDLFMNPPIVIVFSNRIPRLEDLSLDRWKVIDIGKDPTAPVETRDVKDKDIFLSDLSAQRL